MRHSVISEKNWKNFFSTINIAAVRHVWFLKIKNDNYRLGLEGEYASSCQISLKSVDRLLR